MIGTQVIYLSNHNEKRGVYIEVFIEMLIYRAILYKMGRKQTTPVPDSA